MWFFIWSFIGLDNSGVSANYKALVFSNEQSKKLIRVLSRIIIIVCSQPYVQRNNSALVTDFIGRARVWAIWLLALHLIWFLCSYCNDERVRISTHEFYQASLLHASAERSRPPGTYIGEDILWIYCRGIWYGDTIYWGALPLGLLLFLAFL